MKNLAQADKSLCIDSIEEAIVVHSSPYKAMEHSHAVAILTEWDEFIGYDWQKVFDNMQKPAFIFDGRNILDLPKLKKIGFEVRAIGNGNW
jgi:UDPglucose 6-dehydrogenase